MAKKLQVFISSTFVDLKEERQALVQAVLQAGHIPAGMELFIAGDRTQWEVIKEWIGLSDVLVLLLGSRYGSVEPETGLSYTHLEYLHAESLNKPTIGIVLSDEYCARKLQSGGPWFPETGLEQYQAFKTHVMSKICSPVNDLKDITLETVKSLYPLGLRKDLEGWVRGNEIAYDPSLVAELAKLREENSALKARVEALLASIPQDKAVETAVRLLKGLGFHEITVQNGKPVQGNFYLLDQWLEHIGNLLLKWPHELVVGQGFLYQTVAPALAKYGLLELQQRVSESFLKGGPTYRMNVYVLTDLGKRVLADLKRSQLETRG